MPRFSLLTPTRDRPEWLPRAVDSVLAQTFKDWELVVYDNGQPIKQLLPKDRRIKYHHGPAAGPADAFQRALELATGEVIHPFSDDDRLPPDALAVADRELGEALWLTGMTSYENEAGDVQCLLGGPLDLARLKQGYYLGGAIYWRRELTERLGGFKDQYDGAADYDLYLRFAQDSTPAFVDHVMYRYTDHPATDSHVRQGNQIEKTAAIQQAAW